MSNRPGRKISRQNARHPEHRKSGRPSVDRRALIGIGAMAAVIVVIGIVVALAGKDSGQQAITQTSNSVQIHGEPLPTFTGPGTGTDPAIGMTAPGFTTTDFDGVSHEIAGHGGPTDTAKIVGIFAHWCPHCQKEVPIVSKWLKENQLPDRVEVVPVSSLVDSSRGNYPPSSWFRSVDWPGPVLKDSASNQIAEAFGLSSVPYWVVLSPDNKVLDRQSGEIGATGFADLVKMAAASLTG